MGSENTRSSKYNFPQKLYTKNYNNYSELYTYGQKPCFLISEFPTLEYA